MAEKRELSGDNVFVYNNKRPRTNEGSSSSGGSFGEGSPGVSKVLHVRNVSPESSHEELVAFVSQFGSVVAICFLSKFQQALVEMETPQAASAVVMYSKTTPVFIRGKEVYFEYSKSQIINTNATPKSASNPASIHNILLCTILNPIYNITVDVMHAIMRHMSLVEFQDANSAVQAYTALDGKDVSILTGAEKLNVHANNDKSRDYTNPYLPSGPAPPQQPQPPPAAYPPPPPPHAGYSAYPYYPPQSAPAQPPPPAHGQSPVLIVYGLEEPLMNVDRMFNLFSLYGNVHKIKIITHKKGSALVHMETVDMADRAQNSLNGITAFGQQLQIQFSKHQYIAESRNDIEQSASGTNQATKDFTTSNLNRFRNNPNALKHVYRPSMTLYFANAPREYGTLQDFAQLFSSLNGPPPKDAKFFSPPPNATGPAASDERRVGLLEWADLPGAVEALILANNHKIGTHTLRLSFTANSINSGRGGGGGGSGGSGGTSSSTSSAPANTSTPTSLFTSSGSPVPSQSPTPPSGETEPPASAGDSASVPSPHSPSETGEPVV